MITILCLPFLRQTGSLLRWNLTGITVAGTGTSGNALNQLNTPKGVYVDQSENIYVADTSNHRIMLYPATGSLASVFAGVTSISGNGSAYLSSPNDVFVDSSGNVYIADTNNCRIQLVTSTGIVSTVAGSYLGSCGATLSFLNRVYSLYVDSSSNIYVPDYQNSRVVKWAPSATIGILLLNSATVQGPLGIALDSSAQTISISDNFAAVVIAVSLTTPNVSTLIEGVPNTVGSTNATLNSPWGLRRHPQGTAIFIAAQNNHRVQMFSRNPSTLTANTVVGLGYAASPTTLPSGLYYPRGITFDSQMNLFVADILNHRIQRFNR